VASIVVLPRTVDAAGLERRVRGLRVLLYTSGVLFVVAILMTESAYSWLVSFVAPEGELASGLASAVAAGTLLAGAMYTLMLASIYLPAAAVLGYVGRRLADAAVAASPDEEDAHAWLERQGLAVSWRGALARIGTLAAPLVSSTLAHALTSSG
jgi:hypothetical protein